MINLHLGDCMEAMAKMPDKAYDLAIVDPPYGINETAFRRNPKNKAAKLKNYHKAVWRQHIPDEKYWEEIFRVSVNQIVWGGNYFGMPPSRCWLVWDKETKETQWADAELAWTSFSTSVKIFQFAWNGMIQGNMKDKEDRIHPTQKPVSLYKWLLKNYAKPGNRIIDTHGGSMSIAIACYDMGFDLDLWEIDPDYYAAGVKRFEQHKRQTKLFTPQEMYNQ